MTSVFLLAFALGIASGLRSFTPLAAVSWAAHLRWLDLRHTWMAFLGSTATAYIITALALFELVRDKLPTTPSRIRPDGFAPRVLFGVLSGAAVCAAASQSSVAGALLGALGAVVGTLGGYQARTRLGKALKVPDIAVALVEDAVAIGGSLFIVSRLA